MVHRGRFGVVGIVLPQKCGLAHEFASNRIDGIKLPLANGDATLGLVDWARILGGLVGTFGDSEDGVRDIHG